MQKYELTTETMEFKGHTLHRICRCNSGELGGWVESEDNLSQTGVKLGMKLIYVNIRED